MKRILKFKLAQSGVCEDIYTYELNGKKHIVARQMTQDKQLVCWLSAVKTTGYYNSTDYEASCPLKSGLELHCYKNGELQGIETVTEGGYAGKNFNFSWEGKNETK